MIDFQVLGPVVVRRDGQPQPVRTVMLRRLLVVLLADAGTPVPVEGLIDLLWGERPPRSARGTVFAYLSRLRTLLGPDDRLDAHAGAYALRPRDGELDSATFRRLAGQAHAQRRRGEPELAAASARDALALWHGPAFDGFHDLAPVAAEAQSLEELRLATFEDWIEFELRGGLDGSILDELEHMIKQHPYRERLRGQHMLALYRAGRQADALAAYRHAYDVLTTDIGVEPMAELTRLHQQILVADPDLAAPLAGNVSRAAKAPNLLPRAATHFIGRANEFAALDRIAASGSAAAPTATAPIAAAPTATAAIAASAPTAATAPTATAPTATAAIATAAIATSAPTTLAPIAVAPIAVVSAITGTAGVGKTALAVHWARAATARFPDGQLYIDLRGHASGEPLEPIAAINRLLTELGVAAGDLPDDAEAGTARLRALLFDQRILLVLDNASSVDQVRPLLLTGPAAMTVVTSRDRLTGLVAIDGAERVPVGLLEPGEVRALLASLIGAARLDSDPPAVAALVGMCHGLPLAVRITAAALIDDPDLPIGDLVTRMSTPNPLSHLVIDGDASSSVRTAFTYSYLRLDEPCRRMFRLLGLAPGPDVGRRAAAALAGRDPADTTAVLDRLCAAHLLAEEGDGRYAMHDLIRDYAREVAGIEDGPTERYAAQTRIYTWYAYSAAHAEAVVQSATVAIWVDPDYVVESFADTRAALRWYGLEASNLLAAVRAAEATHPDLCWKLAVGLSAWLQRQRPTDDWIEVNRVGARAVATLDDETASSAMDSGIAIALWHSGRHDEAIPFFVRNLDRARRPGVPPKRTMIALMNLGAALAELNRTDEAVALLREALIIIDANPALEVRRTGILHNIGYAYETANQQAKAVPYLRDALAIAERQGDHAGISNAAFSLAVALMLPVREAPPDGPVDLLRQALEHATEAGHPLLEARAHAYLGVAMARRGDLAAARAHLTWLETVYGDPDFADTAVLRAAVADATGQR